MKVSPANFQRSFCRWLTTALLTTVAAHALTPGVIFSAGQVARVPLAPHESSNVPTKHDADAQRMDPDSNRDATRKNYPVEKIIPLTPEERTNIVAELRMPIQVHLSNGQTIPGHSIDVSGDSIQIASAKGAGEVIYTFNVNEVARFTIPGESYKTLAVERLESGDTESAFELMQLLYLQRVKILPLLPANESHFFIYYVELILQSPKPARAIAIASVLRPQISNTAALNALDDAILDSYNTLQLYDEARPLTEAWIEQRSPYGSSALGYYTDSADLLRSEHYEAALDSALQPIVFSTPTPPLKLEHCYAAAISAAIGLRDKDYALTLYQEMQERQLNWPTSDPTFEPYFKQLTDYLKKDRPDDQTPQDIP